MSWNHRHDQFSKIFEREIEVKRFGYDIYSRMQVTKIIKPAALAIVSLQNNSV